MTISQALEHAGHWRPTPSQEIDVELLTFVERYATNLARWDLLIFFGQNPSMRDSAPSIAQQIGRRAHVIEKELDDLAYLGVLRAYPNGGGMLYELAHVPATRQTVVRFAQQFASSPAHD